jgi:uncharacterized protein (TIGR03067 family)
MVMLSLPLNQFVVAVLALTLPTADSGVKVTGDLNRMQGEWVVDHAETPTGEILDVYRGAMRHTLRGSHITFMAQGQEREQTIKLDEAETPKRMEVTDSAGQTGRSVYKIEGDRLFVLGLADQKAHWPTESEPVEYDLLLVYRRLSK